MWAEPTPITVFEPARPVTHTETSPFGKPKPYTSASLVHQEVVVDWQIPDADPSEIPTSGPLSQQAVSR